MVTRIRILPFALAIIIALVSAGDANALVSKKRILILNSYHKGLSWTDNIVSGIHEALKTQDAEIEYYIEYMDTKRYYGEKYFEKLHELYFRKYAKERFDVVIAADNDAFDFTRKYNREIFHSTPVVFCGINNYKDSMIAGYRNFTGVVEDTDIKSTIEVALKLHPQTSQIVVVNDKTTTGIAMENEVREVVPFFEDMVNFVFVEDFDFSELQSKVRALPSDSIVLLTVVNRDRKGNFFAYEESLKLLYPAAQVPIYSVWEFYLGKGIVGGMLTNGFNQGKVAGEITLRILKGEKISSIPVVKKSPNVYMFDYREMERFGVALAKLPPDSTVLNRPDTFYSRYKDLIFVISSVIAALSVIIFILLVHISMRRRYEEAVEKSEKRYRDLYDNAPDMYHSIDREGIIVDCNETEARMLGRPKEEIIGRPIADFQTDKSRDSYLKEFPLLLKQRALYGLEREYVRSDGTVFPASLNVFVEMDDNGEMVRTKTIARDMTEYKRVEVELRQSREELRNLSAHIQSALEEERQNIAREIHDELGQTLSKLKLDISWLKKRFSKDQKLLADKSDKMSGLVDSTISSVRKISSQLRPGVLDYLGLPAAIEWQADEFKEQTGIRCKMSIATDIPVESKEITIAVFRIFQETLTNIMRHAKATRVSVVLMREENKLILVVKDNGIGIPEESLSSRTSFGLMGMQERARFLGGQVKITGAPKKGTTVMVQIPLEEKVGL